VTRLELRLDLVDALLRIHQHGEATALQGDTRHLLHVEQRLQVGAGHGDAIDRVEHLARMLDPIRLRPLPGLLQCKLALAQHLDVVLGRFEGVGREPREHLFAQPVGVGQALEANQGHHVSQHLRVVEQ